MKKMEKMEKMEKMGQMEKNARRTCSATMFGRLTK